MYSTRNTQARFAAFLGIAIAALHSRTAVASKIFQLDKAGT
jgi:hypothetical protein